MHWFIPLSVAFALSACATPAPAPEAPTPPPSSASPLPSPEGTLILTCTIVPDGGEIVCVSPVPFALRFMPQLGDRPAFVIAIDADAAKAYVNPLPGGPLLTPNFKDTRHAR